MCGINLILSKTSHTPGQLIAAMNQATLHRGPDQSNSLKVNNYLFGSNRLKIIDLSINADQPLSCNDKGQPGTRYLLIYNGEIYNYFDLKNKLLQKGYPFKSQSDSEVLLFALVEWGEAIIPELNGMFAFAFYDQQEDRLIMARDRHGMKPLYYFENEQHFIASSEIKGILSTGLIKKELNEQQVFHYLQFKYAKPPHTFYKSIYELEAGHLLIIKDGAKEKIKPFHTPTNPTSILEKELLSQKAEELITDAVFNQINSDRPVGLFLSGGIDSTLLLALLRNNESYVLPACYTIINTDKEVNWGTEDYKWAEQAAKQYNADHKPVEINSSIFLEEFSDHVASTDQPIGDGAYFLTSYLAKIATKDVKVVLSGAGADEYFGGYNRHQAFYKYLANYTLLRKFLPVIKAGASLLPTGRNILFRKQLQLVKKFAINTTYDPGETFTNYISMQLCQNKQIKSISIPEGYTNFSNAWLDAAFQHDRQNYLISDILMLNDKACMQHGLEMRMPYLDNPLTGFASSLPTKILLENDMKWILKDILIKHHGKAYVNRKKEGFGMPFGLWVKQEKVNHLFRWTENQHHPIFNFISPKEIKTLLNSHKKEKADFSTELYAVNLLAHWLEQNFA